MKPQQVLSLINSLARSQGFYGRLLRDLIEADEESRNEWLSQFEDCKSAVDVINKIEC